MNKRRRQEEALPSPNATQGKQRLNAFARWSFYLFMASLAFKMPLPPQLVGYVSPSRIAAVLLIVAFFVSPELRPWRLPKTFLMLVGCFSLILIVSACSQKYSIPGVFNTLQYIQFLLLFYLSYHFFLNGSATRGGLVAYVLSALAVAAMIYAGYSTSIESVYDYHYQRVAAFGEDMNVFATWFVAAFLMCFGLSHSRLGRKPWPWFVSWSIAVPFLYVIIHTGSRGGALGLLVGILTFIAKYGSIWTKIVNLLLVLCFAAGGSYIFMSDELFMLRAERTFEKGGTAGRLEIWGTAWEIIKERPFFGWGSVESRAELARRMNYYYEFRSSHSLLFRLLLYGGFIGGGLFLSALAVCVWHAFIARSGNEGLLPLALLLSAIASHMALGGLADKNMWIYMAYGLAAGTAVIMNKQQPKERLPNGTT